MDKYHVLLELGADEWWPIAPRFGKSYVFTKKEAEEYIAARPGAMLTMKEVPMQQHKDPEYKRLSSIAEGNIALAMKSYESGNLEHARAYLATTHYVLDAMKDMLK